MYISTDKLMHFVVGLAVAVGFWQLTERYAPAGVRRVNPIWFFVMLIWGASGLFIFRKLHVPVLSGDLFYMAVPDWDIPLYNWTRWRFLLHRSWMFHSVLLPVGLLFVSLWKMHPSRSPAWKWLRDGAFGLSVGMSAHLLWDALYSMTKRGFFIHGWNQSTSLAWLGLNLILGLGVPFIVMWGMDSRPRN
ncbi:MAG: hypothetical protein AB4352_27455 [Hormoscilla sp.]